MTIEDMIAKGNKVAHQFIFTGTHDGEFAGIAPTGRQVKMKAAIISRFEDCKEVEAWESLDTLSFYQQLGINPPSH